MSRARHGRAIKRTHYELQAEAEAKDTPAAGHSSVASNPVTVAKRERDAQLRELTDQDHGANLDLGHALIHSLASVALADIRVARFFVLCGGPHSGTRPAPEGVRDLAGSGNL